MPAASMVDLPSAWTSTPSVAKPSAPVGAPASTPVELARWWERFADPELSRLVVQALDANTDVLSAQAALRSARAVRDVQAAGLLPALGGSASAQRSQSGDDTPRNLFQAGFDASWEPDLFGGTRAGVNAAEADAQASLASLGDVQVSIAAEVALAYVGLRNNQARLTIARDNLASQLETLQITVWRTQAGLSTSLEVEQARAAAEQTRAQIPSFEAGIAQAEHSLSVLTGRAPGAVRAPAEDAVTPEAPAGLALSLPAETLRQRADVRAAESRVQAAAARIDQADAARYPSLHIGGSLGLSALTLGALGGGGAVVSSLLSSVSLPIFDGGAARAQVRVQEVAYDQARASYQAVVLTALKDVEDALVALRSSRERLSTLKRAAEAASNAALLARQRYASGIIDFQTVLQTQRTQLSAQDSLTAAQADVLTGHVQLYKALGGGWQPDAPTASLPSNALPIVASSVPSDSLTALITSAS